MAKIRSLELENLLVTFQKHGLIVLTELGPSGLEQDKVTITESDIETIRNTIRSNSKSNGIVESKEKEK